MKTVWSALFIAIFVIAVCGIACGGEEKTGQPAGGGYERPQMATPEQSKKIQACISELRTSKLEDWLGPEPGASVVAGDTLLEIGSPAAPFIAQALDAHRTRFAVRMYLTHIMGQFAVDKKYNSVPFLCRQLESYATNKKYAKQKEAYDLDSEASGGGWIVYNVTSWSYLPIRAATELATIADPKAIPTLSKVMEICRATSDNRFKMGARPSNSADYCWDVLLASASAIAAIEDDAGQKAIDKYATSNSPSLRVASNVMKAVKMMKDDGKAAYDFLKEQVEAEKVPKARDEYRRFIKKFLRSYAAEADLPPDDKDPKDSTKKEDPSKVKDKSTP